MKVVGEPRTVPLADLSPLIDNPRVIDDAAQERLARSLDRFGLYKPLVVWRDPEDGRLVILAGNQRAAVLRARGRQSVDVVEFDGTRAEARAVALRDNNEDGQWSWDDLSAYLTTLGKMHDEDVDWTLTGFDAETVADLMALSTIEPTAEGADDGGDLQNEIDETPNSNGSETDVSSQVTCTIGNIRGRLSTATYGRLVDVWTSCSEQIGTNDVAAVMEALVDRLDA